MSGIRRFKPPSLQDALGNCVVFLTLLNSVVPAIDGQAYEFNRRYVYDSASILLLEQITIRVICRIVEAPRLPVFARAPYCVLGLFKEFRSVDEHITAALLDTELKVVGTPRRLEDSSPLELDAVAGLRVAEVSPAFVLPS